MADRKLCGTCKYGDKDVIEEPCSTCKVHWDTSEQFESNYEKKGE